MHDYIMFGIAISSPFVAILAGYFLNSGRVDRLETHFNTRIDRLETRMDTGFAAVNTRIDGVLRDFAQFHVSASNLDTRADAHEDRLNKIESKVNPS
jgi:hypothetical protein